MTNRKNYVAVIILSIFACVLLVGVWFVNAGDLNPPGGPIGSTHKTLTEIEPRVAINITNTPGDADSLFKISQPGSYYLTGNIAGVAGKHGIEIAASGVSLDLNGFDLVGVAEMGAFDGIINTLAGTTNISVFNGSVRNWGRDGINLSDTFATGSRISDVHVSGNAEKGIAAGYNSITVRCTSNHNQYGFFTRSESLVLDCEASINSASGIYINISCTLVNCTVRGNLTGIETSSGCTLTNCTSHFNTGTGIVSGDGCTIANCSARFNSGNGIISDNGSTIVNCTAYENSGSGISTNAGCSVFDCTIRASSLDGIVCTSSCLIRGNTCSFNGKGAGNGAGIHVTGADNRIERNHCISADRGIDVDAAGNIILSNTCSGNFSDWEIAANNVFGPIVDRRGPASAAVSGFSASSSLGSSEANANFSY